MLKNGKYLMALSISAAGHAIRKAKQPSLTAERDCRKKTGTGLSGRRRHKNESN